MRGSWKSRATTTTRSAGRSLVGRRLMRVIHLAHLDKFRPVLVLTREPVRPAMRRASVAPITSIIHGPQHRGAGRGAQRTGPAVRRQLRPHHHDRPGCTGTPHRVPVRGSGARTSLRRSSTPSRCAQTTSCDRGSVPAGLVLRPESAEVRRRRADDSGRRSHRRRSRADRARCTDEVAETDVADAPVSPSCSWRWPWVANVRRPRRPTAARGAAAAA